MKTLVDRIREARSKATKYNWKYDCGNQEIETDPHRYAVCHIETNLTGDLNGMEPDIDFYNVGDFIALAANDILKLCDAIDIYEKAITGVHDGCDYLGYGQCEKCGAMVIIDAAKQVQALLKIEDQND